MGGGEVLVLIIEDSPYESVFPVFGGDILRR